MVTSQLASPEFQGQWWLLGIVLVSFIFNYFLGEEFLFRGILLLKMHTDQSGIVGLVRRLHGLGMAILQLQIVSDGGKAAEVEEQR